MQKSERYPSYAACVARALSTSSQPLTIDALLSTVGHQRPLGSGARRAIYRAVRELYQAVPVAPSRIGWLSHLLQGSAVRHPLTAEEARRGFLLLDELEHAVFFPQFFQNHRPDMRHLTIELMGGPTIVAEAAIERKMWSLRLGSPFIDWIQYQGGQGRDDIIITVRDAVSGAYLLRLQPKESRDEVAIREQNIKVAMAAEEIVTTTRRADKVIPAWELAALLIGRNLFRSTVPADDLHMVLHKYSMLRLKEDGTGYILDRRVATGAVGHPPAGRTDASSANPSISSRVVPSVWEFQDSLAWLDDDDEESPMDLGAEDEDSCPDYEAYIEGHRMSGAPGVPLSHSDYHLLEAELETLLGLEEEFGYLLADQLHRVGELADRLFIDPESLRGDDPDAPDLPDETDGPPFWNN